MGRMRGFDLYSPTRQICIDRNVEKKKSSSQALLGQAYSTLPCFF